MTADVRQQARLEALERRGRRQAGAREHHHRLDQLGARVTRILARRDELVAEAKRLAGENLRTMTRDFDLSMTAALTHCGADLTKPEALRLLRLVEFEK